MKMKEQNKKKGQRFSLTLLFSGVALIIILLDMVLSYVAAYALIQLKITVPAAEIHFNGTYLLLMIASSLVIGLVLTLIILKIPLQPINDLIDRMNRLCTGDYSARLHFGGVIENHPTFTEVSDSFNKLASELENTELLRSDFINSFSHEFKTPIVSITGLAKLVSKGDITDEHRQECLRAIEEESARLADMATNVLNLSKLENQSIITDVTEFNLSEQIRSSFLLLEHKWVKKDIEPSLELEEYMIEGNEEILKQVWINLLDNAIKFSPVGGTVGVTVAEERDHYSVSVTNEGEPIPEEKREKIFGKFYQADESHSTEGNGIGLAIVKRIAELHSGSVKVECEGGITSFTVRLPKKRLST